MNPREQENDDLTKITGIGSARQQLLRELLNITNYQDLAAISPAEVTSHLEKSGKMISEDLVKVWIAEAIAASQLEKAGQSVSKETIKAWIEREKARESAEAKAKSSSENGEWQTVVTFLVFFQERSSGRRQIDRRILVHDHDADLDREFETFETEEHHRWMLERVDRRIKAQEVEEPPITGPMATVEISEVRVHQPSQSETPVVVGEPSKPFPDSINGDELFSLEVAFVVRGEAARQVVKERADFRVRFYVYDISTEAGILLGDTPPESFEEGKMAYTSVPLEATLKRGTYRLWALVTIQSASARPNYIEIPELQVL